MNISAAIFDLDGTLIDTEDQWGKAFVEVLKSLGKEVADKHPEEFGAPMQDSWPMLLTKYQIKTNKKIDELVAMTYKEYVKQLPGISLMNGAWDFLDGLKSSGVKLGLVTNCEWWVVDKVFNELRLNGIFDAVVTGEETPVMKPSPQPLLLAAEKLGELSDNCLVIGDSPTDVEASQNAEMKVIIIDPTGEKENIDKADLIVEGFAEITTKAIGEL
jgi:HAD superfamily hydrolase (TIGR01549 family)